MSLLTDFATKNPLLPTTALGVATWLLAIGIALVVRLVYWRPWTSPLRTLRGPDGGTGPAGHYLELLDPEQAPGYFRKWTDAYGQTFNTKGPFGLWDRLWTTDRRALHHILKNTDTWEKPIMLRKTLGRYLRSGLINAEGPRHRLVRRIVNPLFSQSNIRGMMPTFKFKCSELRGIWFERMNQAIAQQDEAKAPKTAVLMDVLDGLNRLSFDIIGLTAFDHAFDALHGIEGKMHPTSWPGEEQVENGSEEPGQRAHIDFDLQSAKARAAAHHRQTQVTHAVQKGHGEGSRIYEAYDRMFDVCVGRTGLRGMLSVMIPGLDKIWPTENSRRVVEGMGYIDNLTERLVKAKKLELVEAEKQGLQDLDGKKGRDLLTLIVKADMAMKPSERMTDLEISGALATFMFAGTDTGSIVMAWCLYHLAGSPSVQNRLREECSAYGENISLEDLDTLPLLDMVVKEVYRLNPSIPTTIREAKKDDIIPLEEPIVLKNGKTVSEVKIRKGQYAYIPIEGLNWSHLFWGDDALEFKPDRWADSKVLASTGLGIDQNVLTFIDGPRKCLGYRMGSIEVKSTLFSLVQQFEFRQPEGIRMYKWNMFTNRPYAWDKRFPEGSNMPLIVRPFQG
ncbi:hypothetical protein FFLO_00615 [Filobasidium floriforme]|uniref:Cytochrome P450 n=1 Tax=Filobasidium floriforme TaxID=5210 RepID=A0A8K0JR54_9TREE|nr:hypothetical protein FFLO_00615 [Filobasidium floriforme]